MVYCADRVAELGATVELLKKQLQEQEEEANNVISQWQDSYNDAENRCAEMEQELANIRNEKDTAISEEPVQECDQPGTQDQELMARIDSLEVELTQARDALSGDEDVVNQWEGESFTCSFFVEGDGFLTLFSAYFVLYLCRKGRRA